MTVLTQTANAVRDRALQALLRNLCAQDYRFTTITPASHRRVLARSNRLAVGVEDVLGWSRLFERERFPELAALLETAGELISIPDGLCRSAIRVSTINDVLYLHSAFPTDQDDAVFFGPDSYRFANAIVRECERQPLPEGARILDLGTGSGVGALTVAKLSSAAQLIATDTNARALRLARVNAAYAGISIKFLNIDGAPTATPFDLILINPPYLADSKQRQYRHGGNLHGGELAIRLVNESLPLLVRGGRLLLYTGSAIVNGEDTLRARLIGAAAGRASLTYNEIDPDVFGEELSGIAYVDVDRIALTTAIFTAFG